MFVENLQKEGIFVVHALQGYEHHAERVEKLFAQHQLNFEFVTEGDVSRLTDELLGKYFVQDILKHVRKGMVSCTLNHIYALQKIVERELPYGIIFEDDPCFLGNFLEKLQKVEKEILRLPEGFIISLENTTLTFPSFWQTKRSQQLYPAKMGRMAGAYLIDFAAAQAALEDLKKYKCGEAVDWWHNKLIARNVLKLYWLHPPIVEQGSHNGLLSATISSKPNGWLRRAKWLFQKTYKYYFLRLFNERRLL
jgi:glycosyl transferase family 25